MCCCLLLTRHHLAAPFWWSDRRREFRKFFFVGLFGRSVSTGRSLCLRFLRRRFWRLDLPWVAFEPLHVGLDRLEMCVHKKIRVPGARFFVVLPNLVIFWAHKTNWRNFYDQFNKSSQWRVVKTRYPKRCSPTLNSIPRITYVLRPSIGASFWRASHLRWSTVPKADRLRVV